MKRVDIVGGVPFMDRAEHIDVARLIVATEIVDGLFATEAERVEFVGGVVLGANEDFAVRGWKLITPADIYPPTAPYLAACRAARARSEGKADG